MRIDVEPLRMDFLRSGDERHTLLAQADKVFEEAKETRAAMNMMVLTDFEDARKRFADSTKEEAVDTIVAAVNLLTLMGVGQEELDCINERVHAKNERRGRY